MNILKKIMLKQPVRVNICAKGRFTFSDVQEASVYL